MKDREFIAAISEAGLTPPDFVKDDGVIHRFSSSGKRSDTAGWYVFFGEAGAFGDWRSGINKNWHDTSREYSPEEKAEFARKISEARKKAEKESAIRQQFAAERAQIMWDAAEPAESHPYLTKKGIQPHGARVGRWSKINEETGEVWLEIENSLLVPIRDGSKIVSMQAIFPDSDNKLNRNKDFIFGGKKRGCFFGIGKPSKDPGSVILICEGYATGATLHEATGHPVVVAFDAGNLSAVAEKVREKLPTACICICADNDRWTTEPVENPGVYYANIAAQKNRCYVAIPEFSDLSSKPTDFNDLALLDGDQRVHEIIKEAIRPPETTETTETTEIIETQSESRAVDVISPLVDINGRGTPLSTIENLSEICRRVGVIIRYNVIKKEEEILIPGKGFSVDNQANASLAHLASWCGRFRFPIGQLQSFVTAIADANQFNPVAQWITSKKWDGQNRFTKLLETVKSTDEDLKNILMTRWMISAVAAVFRPSGVSAHGVLVFQGDQYLGKTKWFKSLAPSSFTQDGVMLDPKDRDSVKQAISNWLVELGELDATFRKSDIAQLKAFITKDRDVLRRAYARCDSEYARRTVFFGSVNPKQFLADRTGNRRYWTIECTGLDHSHDLDMQQVWAEVYETLYLAGEGFYLTPEEMTALNQSNENFEVIDPVEDRIITRIEWDALPSFYVWNTATDILIKCGMDRPTQGDATKAGLLLKRRGVESKRSNGRTIYLHPPFIERG